MNKLKWVNCLAFALVIVMCIVIINSVTLVPEALGAGSQVENEEEYEDVGSTGNSSSGSASGGSSVATSTSVVYQAGDSVKAWNVAYDKFNSAAGFKSTITGTLSYVAVGGIINISQTLTNYRTRYGNGDFYSYSRSSGTRETRAETYYKLNEDSINVYENGGVKKYSLNSFKNERGIAPGKFNYKIDESTIVNEISFKKKSNGDYIFVFEIPVNSSALNEYKKFINYNGSEILGNEMPIFTSVKITLTINKNGEFKKIYAEDYYYFNVYGRVDGVSKVTETFTAFKYYEPKTPSWL